MFYYRRIQFDVPPWCSMDSDPAGVKLEQSNPRYDCASTVAVFRVDSSTGSAKSESPSYCDQLSPLLASRTPTWSTETPPREGEVVEETGSWLGAGRVVYSEPQSLRSCWLLVVSTLHDLCDLRESLSGCCAHDHVRHAPAPLLLREIGVYWYSFSNHVRGGMTVLLLHIQPRLLATAGW